MFSRSNRNIGHAIAKVLISSREVQCLRHRSTRTAQQFLFKGTRLSQHSNRHIKESIIVVHHVSVLHCPTCPLVSSHPRAAAPNFVEEIRFVAVARICMAALCSSAGDLPALSNSPFRSPKSWLIEPRIASLHIHKLKNASFQSNLNCLRKISNKTNRERCLSPAHKLISTSWESTPIIQLKTDRHRRTDGRTDRRTDKRTDGQRDRQGCCINGGKENTQRSMKEPQTSTHQTFRRSSVNNLKITAAPTSEPCSSSSIGSSLVILFFWSWMLQINPFSGLSLTTQGTGQNSPQ